MGGGWYRGATVRPPSPARAMPTTAVPPILTTLVGRLAEAVPRRARTTLHRAAARRRDHPRRPRHRRDPGRRAVALLDQLRLVPAARPLGVARGRAGSARGPAGAVRPAGLARGHRRHGGRAGLGPGPRLAD